MNGLGRETAKKMEGVFVGFVLQKDHKMLFTLWQPLI